MYVCMYATAEVLLPRLQHLDLLTGYWCSQAGLQTFEVQLVSTSSLLQLTHTPQLTSLTMDCVDITALQGDNVDYTPTAVQHAEEAAAVSRMLQRLPRQAVLELPGMLISEAAVQQLAVMQGLRQVSLAHFHPALPCERQRLPSSITQLRFEGEFSVTSLPPQLQQLTGLLQLHLVRCGFLPALLGSVTQLQALHLEWCLLLPSRSEGTAAFLDVLPKLSRLQDLQLRCLSLDTDSTVLQRFSALTASSHLTRLVVMSERSAPVPKGAVQHMFASGRRMPHLKACDLSTHSSPFYGGLDRCCIDSADLELISRCCPALTRLGIGGTVQPGADLSGLLQLPDSCTVLSVGGAAFTDAAVATLVQLTQLKELSWGYSPHFTDAGLAQLTALDLDGLHVYSCGVCHAREGREADEGRDQGLCVAAASCPVTKAWSCDTARATAA